MHVVIFSGGNIEKGIAIEMSLKSADLVIAADSGAEKALEFGITPSYAVGDFDSLSAEIKVLLDKKEVIFESFAAEKDETDTELSVLFAIKKGATTIDILGGVEGNRLDHLLANVSLTFHLSIPVRFINGTQVSWIKKGPVTEIISGHQGDLVSLLPLSETVEGIDIINLQYPLHNGTFFLGKARGISNVFTQNMATITFEKGILLFVHTLTQTSK